MLKRHIAETSWAGCNMPLFYVYVYFSFILHIIYNCATTIWFSTIMHSYPHYPQSYPHFSDSLCIVCILSNILHSSVISCFAVPAFSYTTRLFSHFPRLYRITIRVSGTPSPHTFRSTRQARPFSTFLQRNSCLQHGIPTWKTR